MTRLLSSDIDTYSSPRPVRFRAQIREWIEALAGWLGPRISEFPIAGAKCVAHGAHLCRMCHLNPANCAPGFDDGQFHRFGCETYAETGMHWDTCGNRRRKLTTDD